MLLAPAAALYPVPGPYDLLQPDRPGSIRYVRYDSVCGSRHLEHHSLAQLISQRIDDRYGDSCEAAIQRLLDCSCQINNRLAENELLVFGILNVTDKARILFSHHQKCQSVPRNR